MSLPTAVTANFPFPVLTPIATDNQPPTCASLLLLQREVNSNAMSVHSHDGGGLHGHLAIAVSPAKYATIIGNNAHPFPPPQPPPPQPIIPVPATQAQIADAIRRHQDDVRVFQRYHDTDKALVRLIIAATPMVYLITLSDDEVGFANVHTIDLLDHLQEAYAQLTPADRDNNIATMTAPWSPPTPIEALFRQLDAGQRFATMAQEPIADTQLARMGLAIVTKTGLFADGCREWRLRPVQDQTWARFKLHFARQDRDRIETTTAASAGYAANVTASGATTIPPTSTILPATGAANAIAGLPPGTDLGALIAALTRLHTGKAPPAVPPKATTPVVRRGYCWTHGSTLNDSHTSANCRHPAEGHISTATWTNSCGGNRELFTPRARRNKPPT